MNSILNRLFWYSYTDHSIQTTINKPPDYKIILCCNKFQCGIRHDILYQSWISPAFYLWMKKEKEVSYAVHFWILRQHKLIDLRFNMPYFLVVYFFISLFKIFFAHLLLLKIIYIYVEFIELDRQVHTSLCFICICIIVGLVMKSVL